MTRDSSPFWPAPPWDDPSPVSARDSWADSTERPVPLAMTVADPQVEPATRPLPTRRSLRAAGADTATGSLRASTPSSAWSAVVEGPPTSPVGLRASARLSRQRPPRRSWVRTHVAALSAAGLLAASVTVVLVVLSGTPGEVLTQRVEPTDPPAIANFDPTPEPTGDPSGMLPSAEALGAATSAASASVSGSAGAASASSSARSGGSAGGVSAGQQGGPAVNADGRPTVSSDVLGPMPRTWFYVSCGSGNDSGSGSLNSPWRSLRRVQSQVFGPGMGLYLQRGCTWGDRLEIRGGGSSSAPVVVAAYGNGAAPVIKDAGDSGNSSLSLLGDHMHVGGIDIVGADGYGIQLFGREAVVTGVRIRNAGAGVRVMQTGALIDNVQISDLRMMLNTPGGSDDHGAVGVIVEGADAEIRATSCRNCRAQSYDWGFDGGFVEIWNNGSGLSVHDCVAENTQGFLEIGGDGRGVAHGVTMRNNTLTEVHGGVFIHTSGDFGIPVSNVVFSGNTVTNRSAESGGVFAGDLSVLTLRNNKITANQPVAFRAPASHSGNTFVTNNLGFAPGSGDVLKPYR